MKIGAADEASHSDWCVSMATVLVKACGSSLLYSGVNRKDATFILNYFPS